MRFVPAFERPCLVAFQDRQAVDGDSVGDQRVAQGVDRRVEVAVVVAVRGDVDHRAVGRHRQERQDLVADQLQRARHAGELGAAPRGLAQGRGEGLRVLRARDQGPGYSDRRLVRPFDQGHEHRVVRAGEDRALHLGILESLGDAFHLQGEARVVDRLRDIDRQHQSGIDHLRRRPRSTRGQQRQQRSHDPRASFSKPPCPGSSHRPVPWSRRGP